MKRMMRLLLCLADLVAAHIMAGRINKAWADDLLCPSVDAGECANIDQSQDGLAALDTWCQDQNPNPDQCQQK